MSGWWPRISTILREIAIVTEVTITPLPATPLYHLEIWSNPAAVARRIEAALGCAPPAFGRTAGTDALRLLRFQRTAWLVEGDASPLAAVVGNDGALTAVGGGILRVKLAGPAWRTLLMEGGVFDAESPSFAPGHCAATIIDHVSVRLYVTDDDGCVVFVPASFSAGLLHFWNAALPTLAS